MMDRRIEKVFVMLAVLFGVYTLYLLLRPGGCALCLYKEYASLISFILSIPTRYL
jgi:hypothetical protein